MKKLNDNDIYWLIRIIPLIFLSYFQFLSWEQGKWWSILQWISIITSTVALIIFAAHIIEITNINKISKHNQSKSALLIHWCIVWLFGHHIFRIIREIIQLIF